MYVLVTGFAMANGLIINGALLVILACGHGSLLLGMFHC